MFPSPRKLGSRAVFQHNNDPKHTSKTTTALLKKLREKVMDSLLSFTLSPDLNPIEQGSQTQFTWGPLEVESG